MALNEDDFWEFDSKNQFFHNTCNNDKVGIYDFNRMRAVPIEIRLKSIIEIIHSLSTYERISLLNLFCPDCGAKKKKIISK